MSINPYDLEYGEEVIFGGRVSRKVESVIKGDVNFEDGYCLRHNDPMWELAELAKPALPERLYFAHIDDKGRYKVSEHIFSYLPEPLLRMLKQDVASLEEAGVEEGE